jgi:hypothetical protein
MNDSTGQNQNNKKGGTQLLYYIRQTIFSVYLCYLFVVVNLDLTKVYAISKPKMAMDMEKATARQTNTRMSCPRESTVFLTILLSILFLPTHCMRRLCSTPLSLACKVPIANICLSGELKGNMMCLW